MSQISCRKNVFYLYFETIFSWYATTFVFWIIYLLSIIFALSWFSSCWCFYTFGLGRSVIISIPSLSCAPTISWSVDHLQNLRMSVCVACTAALTLAIWIRILCHRCNLHKTHNIFLPKDVGILRHIITKTVLSNC